MIRIIPFVALLVFGQDTTESKLIRFLHRGPNDTMINSFTVALKENPNASLFEGWTVVNEATFNEVEAFFLTENTHVQKFKKVDEYNFRIERIIGNDTTYYLLSGQKASVKYFSKLRSRMVTEESQSKKLIMELDVLLDRIEEKHN